MYCLPKPLSQKRPNCLCWGIFVHNGLVAKGKNKACAKSNCYEIKNLNQNFPICQVLFLFFSFWIFMLISTNSSRRLRCRNILVEKNDNKVHLHYLKKKSEMRFLYCWKICSQTCGREVGEKWKGNFFTVRDMLKKNCSWMRSPN